MPPDLRNAFAVLPAILALTLGRPVAGQVFVNDQRRVEFVGLQRLDPAALDATIQERWEGNYCALNLERGMGFPEAAVFTCRAPAGSTRKHYVVALVEDATRIARKTFPGESAAAPPEDCAALAGDDVSTALDLAVREYNAFRDEGEEPARARLLQLEWARDEVPKVAGVWRFLAARQEPEARRLALWRLDHDPSWAARRASAAILLNFANDDAAWWALADGLRDPDDRVTGVCLSALHALVAQRRRPVDWRPAVPPLQALLAGTNLFAYPQLCKVLVATGVDPALAPALAPSGVTLLAGFLDCQSDGLRDAARQLVARWSGLPADDGGALQEWIAARKR